MSKKYSYKIIPGIHDDMLDRETHHVILFVHTLHEDRPKGSAGYACSGEHVVATETAATWDGAVNAWRGW